MKKQLSISIVLAGFSIILFFVYLTSVGIHEAKERKEDRDNLFSPVGVDYAMYYAAGETAAEGNVIDVYNVDLQQAMMANYLQIEKVAPDLQWFYPPTTMLMLMVWFSRMPFIISRILWLFLTLAFAVYAMYKLLPDHKVLSIMTIGYTAVIYGLEWAQNCFLSVALLSLGLAYIKKKPLIAGLMFGLLTYKPQFAIFPLIILAIMGEWKVIKWAAVFTGMTIVVSLLVFKTEVWAVYLQSFFGQVNPLSDEIWERTFDIQPTLYSVLRLMGIKGVPLQVLTVLACGAAIFAVVRIWKLTADIDLRAASVTIGLLLFTPYFAQYDLMLLAIPFVLLTHYAIKNGGHPLELFLVECLFIMPAVNCILVRLTNIQIAPMVMIAVLIWI